MGRFGSVRIGFSLFLDFLDIELAHFQLVVDHSSQNFRVFEEGVRRPREEYETEHRTESEEYAQSNLIGEDFPFRRMEFDELVFFNEVERLVEHLETRSKVFEFRYEFALNDGCLEEFFFYERFADGFAGFFGNVYRLGFLCHGFSVILSIRSRNLR